MSDEQVAGLRAQSAARTRLGRNGDPEEIAAVAVFFASDASSFITGVKLQVDGGYAQVLRNLSKTLFSTLLMRPDRKGRPKVRR